MIVKAVRNGKMKVYTLDHMDAGLVNPEDLPWKPNVIVSFECWEHMHPQLALRMIRNLRKLAAPDCVMFFSTPCFNGSAAGNHVNETTYNAMAAILFEAAWHVVAHYGTFASQKEYFELLSPDQKLLFHKLSDYYDSNVLATIFAPLFPHRSRNVLWECLASEPPHVPELMFCDAPWSQHPDWRMLDDRPV